jgi:hypothetical protein
MMPGGIGAVPGELTPGQRGVNDNGPRYVVQV